MWSFRGSSSRARVAGSATLAALLILATARTTRADDPIDSVMYRSPDLPTPTVKLTFSEKLPGLWLQALDRPEADLKCQAALTIARAHGRGMPDLHVTIPTLVRELGRPDQHATVVLSAARALVALDAKGAAADLFEACATGDNDLREVVEPALGRWAYGPARDEWLKRLGGQPPYRRGAVLAIQGLAAAKDERAVPRLRELVLSGQTPAATRLEAARALGTLRTAGGEADADALAADASPRGVVARIAAASVLRHHSGEASVRRLQAFVRDAEPSVAAVAVARLVELDPALVEPVLAIVLASTDANVRGFGVEVLFRRPGDAHEKLLGDRLSDPHPAVRAQARRALREHAKTAELTPVAIREGMRILAGKDWRGNEQAAILLAQLEHKPAAPRLVELLVDPRPEAAIAAAWALRVLAVPDTFPRALAHFEKSLSPTQPEWVDLQLTHLVQMLGAARYVPADRPFRAIIPPKSPPGFETRAAAAWALGLIHEGKPVPEIDKALIGRLTAVIPLDVEDTRVRRTCAISLGRMKVKDGIPALRRFYVSNKPSFDPVNNACGWAIEQLTGEKQTPPGVAVLPQVGWFLSLGE